MSAIVEFDEKQESSDENFLSFEALMANDVPEEAKEDEPDPAEVLRQEQEAIKAANEELIANAQAEAERIEKEAYDKGYAAGEEAGKEAGEAAFNDKLAQAAQLISQLQEERQRVQQQYETELLTLIKTMVDRLVNHEVSVNPLVIQKCLQKALGYIVNNSKVVVHLHPNDFQSIKDYSIDNPSLLEETDKLEIVEDPAISQGGCRLETNFGNIDATLENCKDRLYQALDNSFLAALSEVD